MKTITKVLLATGAVVSGILLLRKKTTATPPSTPTPTPIVISTYKSRMDAAKTVQELSAIYSEFQALSQTDYATYSTLYNYYVARYNQLTTHTPTPPPSPPPTPIVVSVDKFNVVKAYYSGFDPATQATLQLSKEYILTIQVQNLMSSPVNATIWAYLQQPNPNDDPILNTIGYFPAYDFPSGTYSYQILTTINQPGNYHIYLRVNVAGKYLKTIDTGVNVTLQNPFSTPGNMNDALLAQLSPIATYVSRVTVRRGIQKEQILIWDSTIPADLITLTGGLIAGDDVGILFKTMPDASLMKQSQVFNRVYQSNNYWITLTW